MNDDDLMRYSRHILLPQVDIEGQEKLLTAKVMIIGLGGLGSPVALYLAASGIGELILCDFDKVDISNLQRQIIHQNSSIEQFKVDSAIEQLSKMNPGVNLRGIKDAITQPMLDDELPNVDLLIDCTDNLQSRLMINQACVKHQTTLVSGAAIRMEGQVAVFLNNGEGPCYQCMIKDTHEQTLGCSEAGVLASTVGIIGTLQAQEALKIILGIGTVKDGGLLLMDGMSGDWQRLTISKNQSCPIC